jgi:glutamine amidotransferase
LNFGSASTAKVVILDYGTGNLHSVKKIVDRTTRNCVVSSRPEDIKSADSIILPGVGHFLTAMSNLKNLDLIEPLNEAVLGVQKPVLGICLGMELMAAYSEEGDTQGLGWVEGVSTRFEHTHSSRFKVPHIGWNRVSATKGSRLMTDIPDSSEFYFAHSYYLKIDDPSFVLCATEYGTTFASAIEKDNIFGVQFHPEKSHDVGRRVLQNFIAI